MTVEEIKEIIYSVPKPKQWREGQFVFNRVEELYGRVARDVQFIDRIDCFYIDHNINGFLEAVYKRLNNAFNS